ncbi:MAG: hypothetical protein MUC71_08490 [Steroidobacteraceae bacterium]|jgi:hypothetical protein|nr:hypothetical protein [Steroidobacteraceae bacterium]
MPLSRLLVIAAFAALAACGSGNDPQAERDREPVETVFDDMISTQDKAQQRLDAAREGHREALERQLEASESDAGSGE